ncbi:hypothetical protein [Xenorhabdus stockiae]|uniref:hypothetical protein n=1 Tax=Xenorhabdus stockiae TaxID=351614 RepID=UPI00406362E3
MSILKKDNKKTDPTPSGSISVSLAANSNVFKEQKILLVVKTSDMNNSDINQLIAFEVVTGDDSIRAGAPVNFRMKPGKESGQSFAEAQYFLDISKSAKNKVSFQVKPVIRPESTVVIKPADVTYNILSQTPNTSINLETEHEFIDVPTGDNFPGTTGSKYNLYSGKLTNLTGNQPLANVQIYILGQHGDPLSSSSIKITTDEDTPHEIEVFQWENRDFFALTTKDDGTIKFRVYPIKNIKTRADFYTGIADNIIPFELQSSIFVFNMELPPSLPPPTIYGMQYDGDIIKVPGTSTFSVNIDPYNGMKDHDALVFFIENESTKNKRQLSPTYIVDDTSTIHERDFNFTYDQLEPNQWLWLTFMVIPLQNEPISSTQLRLKYFQDENEPGANENRIYEKVIVYSNSNNAPKPSETNGIVKEGVTINFDTISNGIGISGGINNGKPGLFVIIEFTKDQSNENLPKVGKKGYLTVSLTGKKDILITFDTQQITPEKDGSIFYISCPIPFCSLTWIGENIESKLKISYTITNSDSGKIESSKVWETNIDTIVVGDDPSVNYGCYNIPS